MNEEQPALSEAVEKLANARLFLEAEKAILSECNRALESVPEYEQYTGARAKKQFAQDIVSVIETFVKQEAVKLYNEDENKQPHPAVEIVMRTDFDIWNIRHLKRYCIEHLHDALDINVKTVQKIVKAIGGYNSGSSIPMTMTQYPAAQIASNLSEYESDES